MSGETVHPTQKLTSAERDILFLLIGDADPTILIEKDGNENITVSLNGQLLDLETVMNMDRKKWLCFRSKPNRYRLTTKGLRIIESRL